VNLAGAQWVTLLLVGVGGASAAAADCPAGQAVSADTAGHCCWPAQAWSPARAACVGAPRCPTGMQASGESCVAAPGATPPSSAAPAGAAPASATPGAAPASATPGAATPANPALPKWTPVVPGAPHAAYTPYVLTPRVPVRFVARDHADDRYRISADGKSCTTPCTLELPATDVHVEADSGRRALAAPLRVPYVASTVEVSHRSRAHYAVGGALVAVGVADVALGFWFAFGNGFDGHEAVGGVNVALGGVAAIIGIVELALVGRARFDVRGSGGAGAVVPTTTMVPVTGSAP